MSLVETEIDSLPNAGDASLELTVVIHTHNSARFIRKTLASLLKQKDIRFDVIVIDNFSKDQTVLEVNAFNEPRLRLLRNSLAKSRIDSLYAAARLTNAEFIAEVGTHDLVLPGCLRKLLDACSRSADTGLVHCHTFSVNQHGETTRAAFRSNRTRVLSGKEEAIDSVRLYRRTALVNIGSGAKPDSIDELDRRIMEKFQKKLVPEFLCARRSDKNLLAAQSPPPLLLVKNYLLELTAAIRHFADPRKWSLWRQMAAAAYSVVATNLSWWPLSASRSRAKSRGRSGKLAYYIWHFPVLSQTFVNRELAALQQSGVKVQIIADGSETVEFADENVRLLLPSTHYLDPPARGLLRTFGVPFFKRHPLRFLNLFMFVITHRHDANKSLADDLYLFGRATHLARLLKRRDIDHIHTPWADRTAYIALLAARLCDITYSVQARAHDIHRKSYLYGLREKFENAEFVITNTRYNEEHIKSLVAVKHHGKIKLVYNGIDLDKFIPAVDHSRAPSPFRILCVARLIEQKGFPYLLEALSLLKNRGYDFRCDIVGGPEQPLYTDYLIQVRKLHRKLGLEDCVFFLEARPFDAVMEEYAKADIFVLPCVIAKDGSRDITPNSLIEAMAMKLPVISTTVTGIPEIVEDGVSGLLVPPNNADAIAIALETLMQQPELRRKLGQAARRRIEERFNIQQNNIERMSVFNQLWC